MRWKRLKLGDEAAARSFLSDREDRCVGATDRFLRRHRRKDAVWIALDGSARVKSFVFLSGSGSLFPVFSPGEEDANRGGLECILAAPCLRSIQGLTVDAEVAEKVLKELGYLEPERIDYFLMGIDSPVADAALEAGPGGLIIRPANAEDANLLFPLQSAYEREEVLPKGAAFNPAATRLALERTIASRVMLVAELDGHIVGKANTNANSFVRQQIGGVYVLPAYRGRGIATRLVATLVEQLRSDRQAATLFVKKRNEAATAVYRRIGFTLRGDYRISYY